MKKNAQDTLKVVKECYEALEDKKAIDIKILKVAKQSSLTDYFVIATGTSEPHLRALRNAIERKLKDLKQINLNVDYEPNSGWAVIDGFDFMVHLFINEKRELYGLENLWNDAEVVDIENI